MFSRSKDGILKSRSVYLGHQFEESSSTPIVLVSPGVFGDVPSPPLGLAYLAAGLQREGYHTEIVDMALIDMTVEEMAKHICRYKPDFIGITVMTSAYPKVTELIYKIKQISSAIIICGGSHATFRYQTMLESNPNIDFICRFESEQTIIELINALSQGRDYQRIPGIAFRTSKGRLIATARRALVENLDVIPLPARELLDMRRYPISTRGTIFTSRGCRNRCVFCPSPAFFGRKIRYHSVQRVIEEVKTMKQRFGIDHFYIYDDVLTADRNRVYGICENFVRERLNITWGCMSRVGQVNTPLLKKMKEAGCESIFFGTESASGHVLKRIKKGISRERIKTTVEQTKKAGIHTQISLMIGLPYDSAESIQDSLEFFRAIEPDSLVINFTVPFPGAELGEEPAKLGVKITQNDLTRYDYRSPVMVTEFLNKKTMKQLYLEAFAYNLDIAISKSEIN